VVNVTNFGMKTLNATPYFIITSFLPTILWKYLVLITWIDIYLKYFSIAPVACARTPYDLEVVSMPFGSLNNVPNHGVEQFSEYCYQIRFF